MKTTTTQVMIYSVIVTGDYALDAVHTFFNKEVAEEKHKEVLKEVFGSRAAEHGMEPGEYQESDAWWDDDNRSKVYFETTTAPQSEAPAPISKVEAREIAIDVATGHVLTENIGEAQLDEITKAGALCEWATSDANDIYPTDGDIKEAIEGLAGDVVHHLTRRGLVDGGVK